MKIHRMSTCSYPPTSALLSGGRWVDHFPVVQIGPDWNPGRTFFFFLSLPCVISAAVSHSADPAVYLTFSCRSVTRSTKHDLGSGLQSVWVFGCSFCSISLFVSLREVAESENPPPPLHEHCSVWWCCSLIEHTQRTRTTRTVLLDCSVTVFVGL